MDSAVIKPQGPGAWPFKSKQIEIERGPWRQRIVSLSIPRRKPGHACGFAWVDAGHFINETDEYIDAFMFGQMPDTGAVAHARKLGEFGAQAQFLKQTALGGGG